MPGRVAGIDDYWQVRIPLDDADGGDVQREAGARLESADAPLAQDHVRVARSKQIVRSLQPLGYGGRQPALQDARPAAPAHRAQQAIVLHVACTDLQNVDVADHLVEVGGIGHFAHYRQPRFASDGFEQVHAGEAQALERERGSTRLERAAAQHHRPHTPNVSRRGQELLMGFDGARPGYDDELRAADRDSANMHLGWLGPELVRGQFVGHHDTRDGRHPRQHTEHVRRDTTGVTSEDRDNDLIRANVQLHLTAIGMRPLNHGIHLFLAGAATHLNDHWNSLRLTPDNQPGRIVPADTIRGPGGRRQPRKRRRHTARHRVLAGQSERLWQRGGRDAAGHADAHRHAALPACMGDLSYSLLAQPDQALDGPLGGQATGQTDQ